jgi:enoyl-CoA hydratase/carnithine racemase
VLVVRLNRPQALNAFEDRMLIELGLAFRVAAADDEAG